MRIFNTFGPFMRLSDGRAVPEFMTAALQGRPLVVHGDGSQTRSLCYVDDLIDGIVVLAASDDHGPMNIGNPEEVSVLELAKLIVAITNSTSAIEFGPRPVDDPNVRRPDITLASDGARLGAEGPARGRPPPHGGVVREGASGMKLVIVGCGHVGLVTAAGFAEIGHQVVGVESDPDRLALLERGEAPFHEPGLAELLTKHHGASLTFDGNIARAMQGADAAFICVNTPPRPDGRPSLVYVEQATRDIAGAISGPVVVVEKSTVPVHTARRIVHVLRVEHRDHDIDVATNPEFLREGSAVHDTLNPDRIVDRLGGGRPRPRPCCERSTRPSSSAPAARMIITDLETAELIKHASNSFLAMKISYINAVGRMCEKVGADVDVVARGNGARSPHRSPPPARRRRDTAGSASPRT